MASCGPAAPPQRHRDLRAGRVRGGSVTHGSCRLTGVGRPNRSSRRGGACSGRLVRLSAVDEHRPGAGLEGRGHVRRQGLRGPTFRRLVGVVGTRFTGEHADAGDLVVAEIDQRVGDEALDPFDLWEGEAEIAIEQGETRYEGVTWTTRRQLASNQLIPLPEPARRGLINLADAVIATTNKAVAAGAQLDPSDVTRSTRSAREAHLGRSAESHQITHPHDPAPRGPRR